MTTFDLTYRIEAESPQKATALREKFGAELANEEDITLINASSAQCLVSYTVKGVDTKSGETFEEKVEAESREEAEEQVGTKTKIVVPVT